MLKRCFALSRSPPDALGPAHAAEAVEAVVADGVGVLRHRQRGMPRRVLRRSHLLPPDVDEWLSTVVGFACEELAMRLALNLRAE